MEKYAKKSIKLAEKFNKDPNRTALFVKIAKSMGLNASVGALQANFGTPQENGIIAIQEGIKTSKDSAVTLTSDLSKIQSQISSLNTTLSTTESQISSVDGQLATVNSQISSVDTQIANVNDQLTATNLTDEQKSNLESQKTSLETEKASLDTQKSTLDSQKSTLESTVTQTNQQINSLNNDFNQTTTKLANEIQNINTLESNLQTTINDSNIGNRDNSWVTVNLDTNNDGIISEADIVVQN